MGAILVKYTIDATGPLTVVDTEFRDPRAPDHRPDSITDRAILGSSPMGLTGEELPPAPPQIAKDYAADRPIW